MSKEILLKTGLTQVQAEIYDFLVRNGDFKASDIGKKIKRPRGVTYKGLDELLQMELVEKIENKKITQFRAGHPSNLEKLISAKEKIFLQDKKSLILTIPSLISAFNINHNKPGVKYYENRDGVIEALDSIIENFKPDTEIISFVKVLPDKFEKELSDIFSRFIRKRIATNIKTRVISIDTPEGKYLKENDVKSLRETRLAQTKKLPLDFQGGEIFIYEDEIYSVMIEKNNFFAFSIQNKSISQLLRAFFEIEWELLGSGDTTLNNSSVRSSEAESSSKTA